MSRDFYNQYVEHQLRNAFNERHFLLLEKTSRWLSRSKPLNILELGCGIGIISFLFLQKFSNIKLTALDLSDHSIKTARKINARYKNRADFICEDICKLENTVIQPETYDVVMAFDIFEHLQKASFPELIQNISGYLKENALLVANIPNPQLLEHLKKENTPSLQPIEEEIYSEALISLCRTNNLILQYFKEYSIWTERESHFYIFKKTTDVHFSNATPPFSFLKRIKRSIFYRYVWRRVRI